MALQKGTNKFLSGWSHCDSSAMFTSNDTLRRSRTFSIVSLVHYFRTARYLCSDYVRAACLLQTSCAIWPTMKSCRNQPLNACSPLSKILTLVSTLRHADYEKRMDFDTIYLCPNRNGHSVSLSRAPRNFGLILIPNSLLLITT